jgi:putative membrane protein insertion efficiency factor
LPNFDAERESSTGSRGSGCDHAKPASCPTHARGLANILRIFALAPRLIAQALISAYRLTLSPFVGLECRHLPTCSAYASESIGRFGLWAGGWIALARLCRCHPFGTSGLDFVPRSVPQAARWYLPWRYGRWRGTSPEPEA